MTTPATRRASPRGSGPAGGDSGDRRPPPVGGTGGSEDPPLWRVVREPTGWIAIEPDGAVTWDPTDDEAECRSLAWHAYLLESEPPDPVPPACVVALCDAVADQLREDQGARIRDGQSAAARVVHVAPRTLRDWISGKAKCPWAAAEVLRLRCVVGD